MSDFKQQYKNPSLRFGDKDHGRILRAYDKVKSRREVRTRTFDKNRKLQDVSTPASPQLDNRKKKLIKWREERNRRKKLQDAKKKPIFKVGIVHHAFYSPITAKDNVIVPTKAAKSPKQIKCPNDIQKRITRATQKRLLAKSGAAANMQTIAVSKNAASKNLTTHPINITKPTFNTKKQKSFAPINHEFRPPSGLPKMPLFGLVAIEQTPSEKGDFFIQDKSKECKTDDINNQENTLSPKLNKRISTPNITNTTAKSKNSTSSKVSLNKPNSQRKSISTVDGNTSVLNEAITRLSLNKQTIQNSLQEEKSLPSSTNVETSSQKTPVTSSKSSIKNNCNEDLIVFSPYLTISRGKNNARKEQQMRLGIGRSPSDTIPTKDSVMKNLNISVEEEERTAQYFKFLLNKETDRLKELCKEWSDIRVQKDIPEDAMYEINQAVGQTNLLISKKFERFRGLVLDCETGRGEMLVTCKDLQGFWDMTYMEVRDCDLRFEKLEQRRNRNWQEEQCAVVKSVPITKKRMPAKKQIASSKPSSLRSLVLAARKKKMAEIPNEEDSLLQNTNMNKGRVSPPLSNRKSVAFKENTQRNRKRSKSIDRNRYKSTPAGHNSSRASLVQKMQFSDTSKRMRSPFTIMKISQMCKTPEIQLDDTILYVNSDQTPGKSILKKSEEVINREARVQSALKVNFDDQVFLTETLKDEEMQTELNLAAAFDWVDPHDWINAGKRLNFTTEDSDNSDSLEKISEEAHTQLKKRQDESESSVQNTLDSDVDPLNDMTSAVSFKKSSPNDNLKINSRRKSLKHQNQHKSMIENDTEVQGIHILPATSLETNIEASATSETISNITDTEQGHDLGVRILRNRIIPAGTPKIMENKMMTPKKGSVSKKENRSPAKTNRKSSLKFLQKKDEIKYLPPNEDDIIEINENIDKRRKSSRKSVAFNVEACLACTEHKPVLPMTPHSKRRSKTPSKRSKSKNLLNEDLISWETPERPPSRVTRSHTKN